MTRNAIDVTETELAILDLLWRNGPSTIRQITDALYEQGTTSEYATVQKLLDRLQAKDCVHRDRSSFAHIFKATIKRSELIGQGLEDLAERLCDGSLTPLLLHLTEHTKLSRTERDTLRRLIQKSN